MKKMSIMNNVTRTFHKTGLQLKKHSPEILVVTGVVGTVVSAVIACKATTKLSEVLDESKATIKTIHETANNPEFADRYTVEDSKKDLAIVYTQTGLKLAKLYGPAVILGVASITSILAGHNILRKRNAALAVAYATVDNSFKEYRSRVVERFGKDLDRELKYNIKAKEVEEVTIDEDGKEQTVKTTVQTGTESEYARFFDEACRGWMKDPEHNLTFLRQQQNYANDLLRTRGHLFLNEVYDMLDIPRSKAGQIVGWVYDEKNPDVANFVDFGIYDVQNERKRAFVNGRERSILLDFNVDGNIWELLH